MLVSMLGYRRGSDIAKDSINFFIDDGTKWINDCIENLKKNFVVSISR